MARKARVKSSTGEYIIMLRGTEETLFRTKKVKDLFSELCNNYLGDGFLGMRFFSDRVVIAVNESANGISADMKPVLISFARSYNREYGIGGKVFKDRFKSMPMENDTFKKECMAYINGESAKDPFKPKTDRKPPQQKIVKVTPPMPEPEQKPKRRNDMPTWLL